MPKTGELFPSVEQIAATLREMVAERGLPAAEIVRRSGLSKSLVYRLLRDERPPSLDALLALCAALDVHPAQAFVTDRAARATVATVLAGVGEPVTPTALRGVAEAARRLEDAARELAARIEAAG